MNAVVLEKLKSRFLDAILETYEFRDELTVVVPKERIVDICRFLKEDPLLQFDLLADVCVSTCTLRQRGSASFTISIQ
jgi:NADH-quinone oxidoreductase subunit C